MKYYEEFKKQNNSLNENQKLKVAAIFTYAPNDIDTEEIGADSKLHQQKLQEVMNDYSAIVLG